MATDLQSYYERLYAGARELYNFGYSHLRRKDSDLISVMSSGDIKSGFIRSLEIEFKPTVLELLLLASKGGRITHPLTEVVITPDGDKLHGQLYFWPRNRMVTLGRRIKMEDFLLAEPLLKRVSGEMDHLVTDTLFEYRALKDPTYPMFSQATSA